MASSKSRGSEKAELSSVEKEEGFVINDSDQEGRRGESHRGTPGFRPGAWVRGGALRWVTKQEEEQRRVLAGGGHVVSVGYLSPQCGGDVGLELSKGCV